MRNRDFAVVSFLVLSAVLLFFFLGTTTEEFVRSENRQKETVVQEPDYQEGFDESYNAGYRSGYFAFVSQDLEEKGIKAVSYSKLPERPEIKEDSESYDKGYVEGYHRATTKFSCVCP